MISFLSPLFLAGMAAVAVPIVLHLLKRKPEVLVRFGPVALLRDAPVENQERRHLRELLLLALRVAALLLLALAFSRPFFASAAAVTAPGVTIVALDTSMSLSAPGQFERAQTMAKNAITRAPSGDLVGVVTFADSAQDAAPVSADRGLATAAVDAARAGFGATRYRAALVRAADMITGAAAGRSTVVVVTDLQEVGWDSGDRVAVPEATRVELADVGAPPPNLAVTSVRRMGDQLAATVLNAGPARDVRVGVVSDSGASAAGQVTAPVGAGQSAEVMVPSPKGRWARVFVDDPQGAIGDNSRFIVLDDVVQSSIVVVTQTGDLAKDAFYVQQALAAASGPAPKVEGVAAAQLSSWDERRLHSANALFVLSTRGLERKGRDLLATYAKGGGSLIVALGPEMDRDVVSDVLGETMLSKDGTDANAAGPARDASGAPALPPRSLAPVDVRHPVFQAFGSGSAALTLVRFERAARMHTTACQVIARFTSGDAALIDCTPGDGRALVFASDLDNTWNDFPLRASFVPFIHEAVRYVTGGRQNAAEYLVGSAPPGVGDAPGVTTVQAQGAGPRMVAVNVDPRESDARRLSADEFQTAIARSKETAGSAQRVEERQQEEKQHIWQYILLIMAATLAVESVVARRTV